MLSVEVIGTHTGCYKCYSTTSSHVFVLVHTHNILSTASEWGAMCSRHKTCKNIILYSFYIICLKYIYPPVILTDSDILFSITILVWLKCVKLLPTVSEKMNWFYKYLSVLFYFKLMKNMSSVSSKIVWQICNLVTLQ